MNAPALLLCTLGLLAAGCSAPEDALPLPGTLERERIELDAEAAEPVVEILVREGQTVEADQVLLKLDDARTRAQVDALRAARGRAERRLAELSRGPRKEAITELRARYDGAEATLAYAEREHARIADLVARKLTSDSDLDRAAQERDAARSARDAARAQLAAALTGTTIEELDQARAALAQADAELRAAEVTLARLTVRAPRAGTVEALPHEVGERPAVGAAVAVLLGGERVFARVFVPEPLRVRVTPGLAAEIRVDGLDEPLAGEVRFIASDAAFTPYYALTEHDRSRLAFLAEVDVVADAGRTLPAGVPVSVDFPGLHD
jgi:HlyD family secretion protein